MSDGDFSDRIRAGIANWHDYTADGAAPEAGLPSETVLAERLIAQRDAQIADLHAALERERAQTRRLAASLGRERRIVDPEPDRPMEIEFRSVSGRGDAAHHRHHSPRVSPAAQHRAVTALWTAALALVAIAGTLAAIAVVR